MTENEFIDRLKPLHGGLQVMWTGGLAAATGLTLAGAMAPSSQAVKGKGLLFGLAAAAFIQIVSSISIKARLLSVHHWGHLFEDTERETEHTYTEQDLIEARKIWYIPQMRFILCYGLCSSVAIYGLVSAVYLNEKAAALTFGFASMFSLLFHYPA
ncbi:MAG: hypothetical protein QF886_23300, partial [Planctomycetota bacterium]|nr:hypothetical protein [Planctomycetota bacterium]